MKKYLIADFKISVDSDYDKVLTESLSQYENDFDGSADIKININKTKEIIVNEYINVSKITDGKFYCNHNGLDRVIFYDDNSEKIMAVITFSDDYSNIEILAHDVKQIYDISDERYIFNLVGNAIHYSMRMHDAVVFHSSAISYDGRGVVFSAVSGTGKSTHTGLWQQVYPETVMVNDDMPVIRVKNNGDVILCGTPWAGTTGINTNIVVPLEAVVFLSRSVHNHIEPIDCQNAIKNFFEGLVSPLSPVMLAKTVDTVNKIFKKVQLLSLSCNMDTEAAQVAKEYIFNNAERK
ncbi:MAG: hypothetical protein II998_06270 [Clostridia bacterium]|nr:hypothetical protein [Clostridia bacterium]